MQRQALSLTFKALLNFINRMQRQALPPNTFTLDAHDAAPSVASNQLQGPFEQDAAPNLVTQHHQFTLRRALSPNVISLQDMI